MHTAICTFDDRRSAEQAVERLVQSGFDRDDVHLEYRHADGTPMEAGRVQAGHESHDGHDVRTRNDAFDGLEREVALDRGLVERMGNFFGRLFARDDPRDHAGTYTRAVDRGHCVVVVDGHSEAEAERAQDVLHGLEAGELNLVHRPGMQRLRDVVAERRADGMEARFGTAREAMAPSHQMDVRREGDFFPQERVPERAVASQGWGEQRTLDIVDDDKPIASPELGGGRGDDKPR